MFSKQWTEGILESLNDPDPFGGYNGRGWKFNQSSVKIIILLFSYMNVNYSWFTLLIGLEENPSIGPVVACHVP